VDITLARIVLSSSVGWGWRTCSSCCSSSSDRAVLRVALRRPVPDGLLVFHCVVDQPAGRLRALQSRATPTPPH